jgi:hypothetical protein
MRQTINGFSHVLAGFIFAKQSTYTPVLNLQELEIQISNKTAKTSLSHSRIALSKEVAPVTLRVDPHFKSVFLIL